MIFSTTLKRFQIIEIKHIYRNTQMYFFCLQNNAFVHMKMITIL